MEYYKTTAEFNCGIDLHKNQMYACVMDTVGHVVVHKNIRNNDFNYFLSLVAPYRHSLCVVCECTYNWYWLADACFAADIEFVLAHALYLGHIHGSKNKNDRIDSEKLAHLLRTNLIPPAYVYPAERRPLRGLLRHRMNYVWQRAVLKGQISMNQSAEGLVPIRVGSADVEKIEQCLLEQYSHPAHRLALSCDLEMIKAYTDQINNLEREALMAMKATLPKEFALLKSIPGVGPITGMTILYEMDTVERFPTVKDFVSYCRLVKGSVASAGKFKGCNGAKMGNAYLRWAFGQAALLCRTKHSLLKGYAEHLLNKHGKFKGNTILATKLARAAYYMLHNGTAFDAERFISA